MSLRRGEDEYKLEKKSPDGLSPIHNSSINQQIYTTLTVTMVNLANWQL